MTARTIIEDLGQLSLFRGLPEHVLHSLARGAEERELVKDEILFRKGDPGDALYMIRSGQVKITTVDGRGRELMLARCGPGEIIGEMSLIDSLPRSASVIALEPARVVVLRREGFLDELGRHPALAMNVMRKISGRLRFANAYIEKAIEWSRRVAEGDYGLAITEIQDDQTRVAGTRPPDEVRAAELLAAFFHLVEGVQAREESLKQQLRRLEIRIDEAKRTKDVDDLTGTDFFARVKARSEELRRQRAERGPRPE